MASSQRTCRQGKLCFLGTRPSKSGVGLGGMTGEEQMISSEAPLLDFPVYQMLESARLLSSYDGTSGNRLNVELQSSEESSGSCSGV